MRAAATLLSSAGSTQTLLTLLRGSGVISSVAALTAQEAEHLVGDTLTDVHLGSASGSCNTLVGRLAKNSEFRETVQRLSRRLSTRTPHVLWLLAVAAEDGNRCALSVWSQNESGNPRVASFVWEPDCVVDSDAETLRALSGCTGVDEVLHARWLEVLGRDALTRRFFRALDTQVTAIASSFPRESAKEDASEIALLYVTRLLFLHFLQAKGWLDGQQTFLADRLDECLVDGGRFHHRVLLPLFFGTLNTPMQLRAPVARAFGRVPFLNGGLFTRSSVERRSRHCVPDELFAALFDELFLRFRFVAREDTATWSEASVDPEMLGRAFESLMASSERKAGGVYYTPHALVERVTTHALDNVDTSAALKLLDPACGSGAFLVHALERIAAQRQAIDRRNVSEIRRDVLTSSIFGVDRSPTAVWLCQLRLWLSVVIESDETNPMRVPPLPNLDRNIRVGDALTGSTFSTDQTLLAGGMRLASMRSRYAKATGARKETLARALDREERRRVLDGLDRDIGHAVRCRRELVSLERGRDLFGERPPRNPEVRRERRRIRDRLRALRVDRRRIADGGALPLSFGALFGDVQSLGGFHAIVGNPPWVRLHNIPAPLRLRLRESYSVFRNASWISGAEAANVSRGFASQVDLAALFVERSVALLRPEGVLALLLPAKLWKSLAGGGVRQLLAEKTLPLAVEDLSASAKTFDAAVYPSILAARISKERCTCADVAVEGRQGRVSWKSFAEELAFDRSPGAPWLLMPRDVRAAFDRFRSSGPALASFLGAPRLGVKSGCNSAFIVRVESAARGLASIVNADGARGTVEEVLLRPALRGEEVVPWRREPANEHVIWTHDARGAALAKLPPRAREWLGQHYSQLSLRSDAKNTGRWWSLFRTDAADASRPRVVWADFGKTLRALVLPEGDVAVPLNTCYVMHCRDTSHAHALCAILNSRTAVAWINAIAEPARGGYRRYLGWTIGLLPLPLDWDRAVSELGDEAYSSLSDEEREKRVLDVYGQRRSDVQPLIDW